MLMSRTGIPRTSTTSKFLAMKPGSSKGGRTPVMVPLSLKNAKLRISPSAARVTWFGSLNTVIMRPAKPTRRSSPLEAHLLRPMYNSNTANSSRSTVMRISPTGTRGTFRISRCTVSKLASSKAGRTASMAPRNSKRGRLHTFPNMVVESISGSSIMATTRPSKPIRQSPLPSPPSNTTNNSSRRIG